MPRLTPEEEDRLMIETTKSPQQKVVDLWYKLPAEKRKDGRDVLAFFESVVSDDSYLLRGIPHNKYQTVQAWVREHLGKP